MYWILSIEEAFRLAPLTGLAVFFVAFRLLPFIRERKRCVEDTHTPIYPIRSVGE
jgi:hypothetical protein